MTRAALAATLALLVGACFNPSYDHPTCGPEGQCPSGSVCVGGTCEEEATELDARIDSPIDSAIDSAIDAPIDAAIDGPDIDGPNIDAPPLPVCPGSDVQSPTDPNRCFRRLTNTAPWDNMRSMCQALGAGFDLADIRDPQEQQALMAFTSGPVDLWIGARDPSLFNMFEWISGFPFNYTHWGAGQPNSPGGCVRIRVGAFAGEWWDQECSAIFGALCVHPAS